MTAATDIAIELLDDWLGEQRERLAIAGLVAGAVLPDGTEIVRAHGLADVSVGRPVTGVTPFRLCSLTKTFTGTLVLIARDRGLLGLDDPVEALVPELDVHSPARDPRPITLRQCLTHTAGLPKDFPFDYWQPSDEEVRVLPALDEALAALAGSTLVNVPGTVFHYSNVGFALLGLAAERALGRPYAALVEELILAPLGMDGSFVWAPERRSELTRGYLAGGRERAAEYDLACITAAGGVCASAEDLLAYLRLQLSDESPEGATVLRGASLREARTPSFLLPDWSFGTGLAWRLSQRGGQPRVSHPGDLVGAQVEFHALPEQQLGLFILANTFSFELVQIADELLTTLAGLLENPSPAAPAAAAVPELDKAVGHYVGEYFDYEVARVGDTLRLFNSLDTRFSERLEHEQSGTFVVVDGFSAGERAVFAAERDGAYQTISLQSQLLHRAQERP